MGWIRITTTCEKAKKVRIHSKGDERSKETYRFSAARVNPAELFDDIVVFIERVILVNIEGYKGNVNERVRIKGLGK